MKFTNPEELVGKIVKSVYSGDPTNVNIYFVSGMVKNNYKLIFLVSHNRYPVGKLDYIEQEALIEALNGEYSYHAFRYDWNIVEGKR